MIQVTYRSAAGMRDAKEEAQPCLLVPLGPTLVIFPLLRLDKDRRENQ